VKTPKVQLNLRDAGAIALLLMGLHLRAVETFELSPSTTQLLSGLVGPAQDSPRGALRQFVIETTEHRHRITPPAWVGWSCLSIGGTLLACRAIGKR
jgi:hypothetical protein